MGCVFENPIILNNCIKVILHITEEAVDFIAKKVLDQIEKEADVL